MIGNDIVDLALAKKESNWQRKGFLDKIFTKNEQAMIQLSQNQENTIWNLWSRKEAAYKVWNRETRLRKCNPIKFECLDTDLNFGIVQFENNLYFTKTEINNRFIHTIAVNDKANFDFIKNLDNIFAIEKNNGIPFYRNEKQEILPVSISNHGQYEKIITIKSPT